MQQRRPVGKRPLSFGRTPLGESSSSFQIKHLAPADLPCGAARPMAHAAEFCLRKPPPTRFP